MICTIKHKTKHMQFLIWDWVQQLQHKKPILDEEILGF